jgi:hypothetical protein
MSDLKEYYNGEDTIQLPPPYSDYAVRPMRGQVINTKTGRFLWQTVRKENGFKCVGIKKDDGRWSTINVHFLIGLAIIGKKLDDFCVAHIGDIKNNSVINLKICKKKIGQKKRVGAFKGDKMEIEFDSVRATSKKGFCDRRLSLCCNGKAKAHKGYVWKFL